jgi:lysozyme family protein
MYYDEAYKETMNLEGGYANSKDDKGGETYCGIARNFHPSWEGWEFIDNIKLSQNINNGKYFPELESKVKKFYKICFWDVFKGDKIHDKAIAMELFDTSVNMGHKTGVCFMQRGMNVLNLDAKIWEDMECDGIVGPKTLRSFNIIRNYYPRKLKVLLKIMNCLQGAKYVAIAEKNQTQEVWMVNWFGRVSI